MARLPTVESLGRRPTPRPVRPIASVSQAAASAPGRALADLGNTAAAIGDRIYDREATAAAKERDALVADDIRALLYDPENGFLNKQGGTAVNQRSAALEQLERIKSKAMEGLNNGAQRKLSDALTRRLDNAAQAIDRHTGVARETWLNGASQARIESAHQDALMDPSQTQEALRVMDSEIVEMAAREGWSQEKTALEREKARSKVYSDQVMRIASTDPIAAAQYMRDNQGSISAVDLANLEAKLQPEVKKAIGRRKAEQAFTSSWIDYKNTNATRNDPLSKPLVSALSFLPAMGVRMEVFSGGQEDNTTHGVGSTRHNHGNAADVFFYKDGRRLNWANPDDRPIFQEIVRRARANGVTGFGAGPGYMAPGSMHIGFGNPAVWGAGGQGENAPDWLKEAYTSTGKLPDLPKVTVGGGLESLLDIEDPVEREAAIAEYNLRSKVASGQRKARLSAARDAAFQAIEAGTGVDNLPLEFRQSLGMEGMSALRTYEGKLASGDPVKTDPHTYLELRQMQANDPAAFDGVNLIEYVDRLSPADFKTFADQQAKGVDSEAGVAASTLMTNAKRQLEAAGIDTTPDPGSDDAKSVAAIQTRLLRWQDKFMHENGRKPTQTEIDERVANELIPVIIDPPGFGNKVSGRFFGLADLDLESGDLAKSSIRVLNTTVPAAVINEQIIALREAGEDVTPENLVSRIVGLFDEAGIR